MRKPLTLLLSGLLTFGALAAQGQCLTISLTEADVTCYGDNDGQVIVDVNTGVSPFTYELFFFQPGFGSTKLGEVNTAGTHVVFKKGNGTLTQPGAEAFGIPANAFIAPGSQYQVTVSASGSGGLICETKTSSVTVGEPAQLTASVNSITPACSPGTGAIDLNVAGGTPTYSFVWSGPTAIGNVEDPTNLDGGTYSVVITDNAGCQNTSLNNIVVTMPTVAAAGPDQDVCLDNTTLAANSVQSTETGTWSVISGTGSFSNVNSPSATVTGLSYGANQFRWTITDNNAICAASMDDVIITRHVEAAVDAGADQSVCSGSAYMLAGSSVSGSASTGAWSIVSQPASDGMLSSTAQTATPATVTFTGVTPGNYTLRLTTDDPAGPCGPVTDDVVITVDMAATANAGANKTICGGTASAFSTATIGGSATTGAWSIVSQPVGGDGLLSSVAQTATPATVTFTATVAGTYTIRLTTDDPPNTCPAATDDIDITVNLAPAVNAGPDAPACAGSVYTLAGATIGGLASTAAWSILSKPVGGNGVLSSTAQTATPATVTFTATVLGNYTLRLTTNNPAGPCGAVHDDVVITIEQAPTVNAGADKNICGGTNAPLTGATIGGSASTGAWSIFSQPGGGDGILSSTAPTATPATVTFSATVAGSYVLRLTTDDPANSCGPVTDDVTITIFNAPQVNAGADQSVCAGTVYALAGSSVGGSATTGAWSILTQPGGGNGMLSSTSQTASPSTVTFTATVTGAYTLRLTTNNPAGPCGAIHDDVVITIDQAATANAGADKTNCAGTVYALAGSSVGGSASTGAWSITTQPIGGDGLLSNTSQTAAPSTVTFTATVAGSYTLKLTTDDPANSCGPVSDDVVITINTPATANAGADNAICTGTVYPLAGSSVGGSASTGAWSIQSQPGGGDGMLSSTAQTATPSNVTFTATVVGVYTLRLTTNNPAGPCGVVTDDVAITVDPAATANAGSDQTVCSGDLYTLAGSGFGGSASTAAWSIFSQPAGGDGAVSTMAQTASPATVNFQATVLGTYQLRLTTDDPAGACGPASDDVIITLVAQPTANAGGDQEICSGDVYTLAGTGVGGTASTGAWSIMTQPVGGDGMLSSTAQTPTPSSVTFTATVVGVYTLTLTTDDPAGTCVPVSDNVDITVDQPAVADAGSDQLICAGDKYTLAGSGFSGSATMAQWSISNQPSGGDGALGSTVMTTMPDTTTFTATVPGDYTLVLTTDDPSGPCGPGTSSIVITVPGGPAAPGMYACQNGAAPTLTASTGYAGVNTFNWYTDMALTNLVFSGAAYTPGAGELDMTTVDTTVFYVTIKFTSGCETFATADSVFVSEPTAVTVSDTTVCELGGLLDLNAAVTSVSPSGGTLSFAGTGVSGNTFDPTGLTGVNAISVTYTRGGCSDNQNLSVTVVDAATITLPVSPPDVCESAGNYDLAPLVSGSPAGGAFTFAGAQVSATMLDPSGLSGIQKIAVDYSANGCVVQDTLQVNVISTATITQNLTDVCQANQPFDLAGILTASPPGGTYTFSGSGVTGSMFDPSGLTGNVNISVTYDMSGCTSSTNITLTVHDSTDPFCSGIMTCGPFTINATDTAPTCANQNDGEINLFITGGTPDYTVLVTDSAGFSTMLSGPGPQFDFTGLPPADYYYEIQDQTHPICSLPFNLPLPVSVTASADPLSFMDAACFDQADGSAIINATGSTTGKYFYSLDGSTWMSFTPGTAINMLPPNGTYPVLVGESSTDACRDTVMVTINNAATSALAANVGEINKSVPSPEGPSGSLQLVDFTGGEAPYQVKILLDSAFIPGQSYSTNFDPVQLNGSGDLEKIYAGLPPGAYVITVEDDLGCDLPLTAIVPMDVDLLIPNVFTPNGDSYNDTFFIRNLPTPGAKLVITNRWGKEVYSSADYKNDWDGGQNPDGIYFYHLNASGTVKSGWIEIVRSQHQRP